ncbi:MAG: succinylglutamate desuccinylase/aspartoacylase family protein [Gammaproteobacteria bacterium]|nr:MAG: succinylglutamate desuccinylase/aspartoacylase family protein [Gammaproteobacteria bacterium]
MDENEESVIEEAEDEDVDDIDDTLPRQTLSGQNSVSKAYGTTEDSHDKPLKIAPNIDLKEVAPAPSPKLFTPDSQASGSSQDTLPESTTEADELTAETIPPANSITLIDTEVLPGTSTRIGWSPGLQISGLSSPTPVLVVNGIKSGPTLCLVGAIHGDELNGIEIVRRVLYDLDPMELSGTVIGVPIVNLQGFQQGNRYLPDRRDLNRHFPGKADGHVAERFAHALFSQVIRHCDMLVDIHTGSLRRTNLPQLRADMNNPEVATFTRGFDRIAVVHSTGTRGMLRTAALAVGITAVTMEAGESLRIQQHQIKAGVNSLHSLMEKQDMISRLFSWGDPEPVYYDSYWIRAEYGGILASKIVLGAQVIKGQVLGVVTDPITNAQYPIKAKGIGRVIGMAVDQVVMSGFAAYHIGTEAEVPAE